MTTFHDPLPAAPETNWFEKFLSESRNLSHAGAKLREWLALVAMVVAADLLIFRGHGFLGLAAFIGIAPACLAMGARVRHFRWPLLLQGTLIALLCARLAWQGSPLQVFCGLGLVVAFACSLSGLTPHLVTVFLTAAQCSIAGAQFISGYLLGIRGAKPTVDGVAILKGVLPIAVVVAFATIFILANPDAVTVVYQQLERAVDSLAQFVQSLDLSFPEVLFCILATWITVGLFRPLSILKQLRLEVEDNGSAKPVESPYYAPFRNTLLAVIVLFAGYLVVEFSTLWFRNFPENFYYAGYAHQGAAWLTVALALATAVLSVVFSRATQLDPRAKRLRQLAYIWSFQNLLLSVAVYNRLSIYVGYNGMTYWRIVGYFGISVVVAGFALVVWKIVRDKSFLWLVHRQLWAVSLAVYLFALAPVDAIAVRYNTSRILRGDTAACMQIGVQKLDIESKLMLLPLLESPNREIREGVAAILASEYEEISQRQIDNGYEGWTATQLVNRSLVGAIEQHRGPITPYLSNTSAREASIKRFYEYAYQWY
jgi:hypothetical protein